jgi:hypothetical protein
LHCAKMVRYNIFGDASSTYVIYDCHKIGLPIGYPS